MENPRIETRAKIRDILRSLTGEERRLLAEVVGAERENLDTSRPGDINADLWKAITETIR